MAKTSSPNTQDNTAIWETLLRGADRDVVRATAENRRTLPHELNHYKAIEGLAGEQGTKPDSLSLNQDSQVDVHVSRETLMALRNLDSLEDSPSRIPLLRDGPLGELFSALLEKRDVDASRFSELDEEARNALKAPLRILSLGADRDLARAELDKAAAGSHERSEAEEVVSQARRDYRTIETAAKACGVEPEDLKNPQTPAETHVARETLVALRQKAALEKKTDAALSLPGTSPLHEIFTALAGKGEGNFSGLSGSSVDGNLKETIEILWLGAKRDAIKASRGLVDIPEEALAKDCETIGKAAEALGVDVTAIKPDTPGKAHVTRELFVASRGTQAHARQDATDTLNLRDTPLEQLSGKMNGKGSEEQKRGVG